MWKSLVMRKFYQKPWMGHFEEPLHLFLPPRSLKERASNSPGPTL
jgi:hypothetical protein